MDSDTRRQSGLWRHNEAAGFFEREVPSANPGPYQYNQPPRRASASDRRSFAERAGATRSSYDADLTDQPDAFRTAAQNAAVRMDTTSALLPHEEILASPEHADLIRRLHKHEAGGDAGSAHFANTGHAMSSLPPAIPLATGAADSHHFSETRHINEASLEDVAGNVRAGARDEGTAMPSIGDVGSSGLSKTRHINETDLPNSSAQPSFFRDVGDTDDVPENLRTKAWSPTPDATPDERNAQTDAEPSDAPRRASVADQGPLQKLERAASKEEKRARLQVAENRAIQRQGTLRSEKGRVVSDGSSRPSESTSDKYFQHSPRHVSTGSAKLGTSPMDRYHRASSSFHHGSYVNGEPSISREPRPYHHAPPIPRSLDSTRRRDAERDVAPAIANQPRPYHHAPAMPRSMDSARRRDETRDEQPAIAREPRPYHHAPAMPRSMDPAVRRSEDGRAFASQATNGTPPIAKEARPYHHAPTGPRNLGAAGTAYNEPRASIEQPRTGMDGSQNTNDMQRSGSGKYKHRLRDAGFIGAASAAAVGTGALAYEATSADKDNATTGSIKSDDVVRSGSKRLQKQPPANRASLDGSNDKEAKQALHTDRSGIGNTSATRAKLAAHRADEPDIISREQAKTDKDVPVPYRVPPQTAAGKAAREQVGFDNSQGAIPEERHHHGIFHHHHHQHHNESRSYQATAPLEEWRGVPPVFLTLGDLELDNEGTSAATDGGDSAWWERNQGPQRATSSSSRPSQPPKMSQYDGAFEEEAKLFLPPMFLKCGPLLRYTGLRREGEREIWRGSIMIVTEDEQTDTSTSPPTLRLFAQPMDLHQPPSRHLLENGQSTFPDHDDPVAGQVKVSRTGRPLYVRPVSEIEPGVDLSREENNQGLYAATRTPVLGPQMSEGADGRQSQHMTFQDKSRIKGRDGEKAGRYKEVKAVRLHAERGFTFWRWSVEIELGSRQHRVAYRINRGPALGFWVPARGETMNMMFHSCNGFSMSVNPDAFSGPDPLWRDVLNRHQSRPFHVMIGGGDQVYNDAAMRDTTLFRDWLQLTDPAGKHGAEFSPEMQDELENFYLHRYSMWFSQGLFAMAGSQIPMVNVWDDHDIIDGYGSYPHHFMSTRVFTGLGAIAFKYYMLFQHQSVAAETAQEEPSWVLGAGAGPYINELSRNVFLDLGRKVKFLGIDCRTERMRDEILSEASYEILFNKCRAEIKSGETKHLIVLLGVPIAYPRLNFLENILTSRVMDPIKALGRTGMLGGFVNKFDGGVEILDDLDDHWTAKHHKAERNWFIQELQELAAEKSVRVTILGGDVHLGAVGQFYTPKKMGISKDHDHRYMPNVISSAIVNTPPPTMMADVLNRRNKVHHLDAETDEDLIPMFEVDVDGSKRNNKCLLPKRNYCTIREFQPGHTPPSTPPPERNVSARPSTEISNQGFESEEQDRRYPPGSMARRTRSLTRGPVNLVRRLSGSRAKNPPSSLAQQGAGPYGVTRSASMEQPRPTLAMNGTSADPPRRPSFHRRPTNMTEKEVRKAAAKGGAPDEEEGDAQDGKEPGHINLEFGLDISLNMEIDQHDPAGATQGYRLLVPALWYSGPPDVNPLHLKSKRGTILARLRSRRNKKQDQDYSRSGSPTPPPNGDGETQAQSQPNVGNYAYGTDGSHDPRGADTAVYDTRHGSGTQQRATGQTASAYGNGYNLAAPPIGSGHMHAKSQESAVYNNPYPFTGHRRSMDGAGSQQRASQSQQQAQQQQLPYSQKNDNNDARELDANSEGESFTSDEYFDARDRPAKRWSKTDKFFGIAGAGGDGGKRYSFSAARPGQGEGPYGGGQVPERKKANWRIWK